MAMPTVGVLEYNGVRFDELHKTEMSMRPVYDGADRQVKYLEYTLTVVATITSDAGDGWSTDDQMTELREKLISPGKRLLYQQKGLGIIDTAGIVGRKDVHWGPKPQELDWFTYGMKAGGRITWKVKFCLPQSQNGLDDKAISAFTYSMSAEIDNHGYAKITYHAELEIAMTWKGDGTKAVPDSADNYRLVPPLMENFKRESTSVNQSADRTKLTITVVDKELPVPLPLNCTLVNMRYSVRSSRGNSSGDNRNAGFYKWYISLSGTIHTIHQVGRPTAWQRFREIMTSKRNAISQIIPPAPAGGGPPPAPGPGEPFTPQPFLTSFEIAEEDMFGPPSTHFEASFTVTGVALWHILIRSGLWIPINTDPAGGYTSFARWRNSMFTLTGEGPYGRYGNTGAVLNPGETIIDLNNT